LPLGAVVAPNLGLIDALEVSLFNLKPDTVYSVYVRDTCGEFQDQLEGHGQRHRDRADARGGDYAFFEGRSAEQGHRDGRRQRRQRGEAVLVGSGLKP
jgi:hypothetical protein